MSIRDRLSGNEAVAYAMKQINPDVMGAFPITPSTEIPQYFAQYVANGEVDTEYVTVESEHSSMSTCIGAEAAGARVVGTGRSDFPNQVNNVVAFPGIFKGALEGRATQITDEMKLAAAEAIASLVPEEELNEDNIMPEAFNPKVAEVVANAVKSHIRN